jgi:hypothetical protein
MFLVEIIWRKVLIDEYRARGSWWSFAGKDRLDVERGYLLIPPRKD